MVFIYEAGVLAENNFRISDSGGRNYDIVMVWLIEGLFYLLERTICEKLTSCKQLSEDYTL